MSSGTADCFKWLKCKCYVEDLVEYLGSLWIYVVTAEDLAISKLGRFGEQDRQGILTLLRKNCLTVDNFYTRASEAIN